MWNALIHDSGAAIAVFDAEGWAHYANNVFLRMAGVRTIDELKKLSIEERLQHDMAEERLLILRDVIRNGHAQMFRDMRRGRALVITARQFPGQPQFCLAVYKPADIPNWASDADPTDVDAAQIKHVDAGPLAVLSEREKEILALIGQGLTSAQIAKKLCRTIKTIEWHRSAIARKLHTKDRVALAQLAIQAGLCSRRAAAAGLTA
jgi:DNA-binding NarL/FixJ family response regulator